MEEVPRERVTIFLRKLGGKRGKQEQEGRENGKVGGLSLTESQGARDILKRRPYKKVWLSMLVES